jgi:3-phenylpropionate/cinnamic acid dioxygenase small subunit
MALGADDRLAIIDLLSRYGHTYDEGRVEALGELFTEDGEFEIRGRIGGMPSVLRGRAEIVRHMTARRQATLPAQRRHVTTNLVVDDAGSGRASAACYLLLGSTADGTLQLPVSGRYVDDLEKGEDGRWRFRRRVLTLDGDLG